MPPQSQSPVPTPGIKWNEVTWYSKLGAIILFVGVVPVLTFYIGMQYEAVNDPSVSPAISQQGVVEKKLEKDLLTVPQLSGPAPFSAIFMPANMGLGDHWIEFGDGSRIDVTCELYKPDTDACLRMNFYTHEYAKPGTYTAIYKESPDTTLDSATITVLEASATTLPIQNLGGGYSADKNDVYYAGAVIKDADRATFKVIYRDCQEPSGTFGKDQNHVYKNGVVVPNTDPAKFDGYSKPRLAIEC